MSVKTSRQYRKITRNSVISLLDQYKVGYQNWGFPTSYDLHELVRRLNDEQVTLKESRGHLVLVMNVAVVHVHYEGTLGRKTLFEEKQYFHDSGRIITRVVIGIGETMKVGDNPENTVKRLLGEKLGQSEPKFRDINQIPPLENCSFKRGPSKMEDSVKWPGLKVILNRTPFKITIDDSFYLERYEEVIYRFGGHPFKTTTFSWKDTVAMA